MVLKVLMGRVPLYLHFYCRRTHYIVSIQHLIQCKVQLIELGVSFATVESLNEADVEQERLATSSIEVEFIVKGLCEALMDLLSNICGDTEIVKGQIEACFRCYRALLHFKHKGYYFILNVQP